MTRYEGMPGEQIIGVVTTGVYCRPGCPARAPRAANVRRFRSARAARAAGFRACKRCRPEGRPEVVQLPFRGPFDGRGLIAFLSRRAVPGVEEAGEGWYRRSLRLPHGPAVAELRPLARSVKATLWLQDPADRGAALRRLSALLDLDREPLPVVERLGSDPVIGALVRSTPGRRVPGCVDPAEIAVRAVLGQQVSLAGAATLAGRLVAAHGERLAEPVGRVTHLFPTPDVVAAVAPDSLAMPRTRRSALLALTAALARCELRLEGAHPAVVRRDLLALPGIGPWTADYVLMRGLRDPDAFLSADLGVRHALARLGQDHRPAAAARLAERWRPYRAYALMHLWEGAL